MRDQRRPGRLNLTRREREVFCAVLAGKTSKEIAEAMGVAYKTVDTHRTRINLKLGARSPIELALKTGLLKSTVPTSADDPWFDGLVTS